GRREPFATKGVYGGRQQHRLNVAKGKSGDAGLIDLLQVIRRGCPGGGSHLRGAGTRKLVRVDAQTETQLARRVEDPCRRGYVEYLRLAKNIAVLSQALRGDGRQHVMNHQVDVFRSTAAILVGNFMCTEEGGNIA